VFARKFPRLPFWPVTHGLLIMLIDKLGFRESSQQLEDSIGGRVCPMMLEGTTADPFILMVHHTHSFAWWDPFRWLVARLIPEGFPAHPHAGFCTLTYVLRGRVRHRDSIGCKQTYGEGAVQYLSAG
jgi:redox-sensitive bicupin YhaK (pirin superfamily)